MFRVKLGAYMRPRILVLSGVRAGAEFPLSGERFSIGRDPGADLSIAEKIVSWIKASIK